MSLRKYLMPSLFISSVILSPASYAADQVIKVGTLKVINSIVPHFYEKFTPPGYKIQVIPFETPTDGKNAVVSKSVDFGTYGVAAAILGASVGEPVKVIAPSGNGGVGIVVAKNSTVQKFKDLKGKKVGILPGSTQEAIFLERLKEEGMTLKDIKPVRLAFSEMAGALERHDIDAYAGSEPGPSVNITRGTGRVLEYPYKTGVGNLNTVMTTHANTLKTNPELVKVFLQVHKKATEYANNNRQAVAEMASKRLGLSAPVADLASKNVSFSWKADATWNKRVQYYSTMMLERKQIRKLPTFNQFVDTRFIPAN